MGITGMIKKSALIAGIMLLGLAAACGGDNGGDSGSLFPQRANIVGSVATGEALDAIDLDLIQLIEMLSSGSEGDAEGIAEFFGIDQFRPGGLFGDISQADIFGEITDGDDVDYFGILVMGSFDETALIAALASAFRSDLVIRDYQGNDVYSSASDAEAFELSILDDSTFVLGSRGAVNDVINIKAGDADPASGPLMDTLNDLGGDLFRFAFEVPQEFSGQAGLGSIPQLGDLPISLDFISALDIVGLGGALKDGSLELTVAMDFTGEDAAESLEGFISGIVTLASGFLTDPSTVGLLAGLEIDRDGSLLTIKIGIPLEDIPDIFGNLISPATTESSGDGPPGTPEIRLLSSVIGEPVPILRNINHVPEGQRVDYSDAPPTSGEHWPTPASCGFYPDGLPDERVVHNLEHGAIVVSYNFTNPAQVTALRQALSGVDQFDEWGIARAYDRIPDGQVALAAWGHLHRMAGVSPGEIGLFFDALAGHNGPERFTC